MSISKLKEGVEVESTDTTKYQNKVNKMSEIKLNLSLKLRGGSLLSEQECSRNSRKRSKQDCYDFFDVRFGKKNKERIKVAIRKPKTIRQNIKISKEAYDYMTSLSSCPADVKIHLWKKYSIAQRLNNHLSQIAHDLGALSYTYELLED